MGKSTDYLAGILPQHPKEAASPGQLHEKEESSACQLVDNKSMWKLTFAFVGCCPCQVAGGAGRGGERWTWTGKDVGRGSKTRRGQEGDNRADEAAPLLRKEAAPARTSVTARTRASGSQRRELALQPSWNRQHRQWPKGEDKWNRQHRQDRRDKIQELINIVGRLVHRLEDAKTVTSFDNDFVMLLREPPRIHCR